MTLIVNDVNMIPYLAHKGIQWKRNDIDSSDAGRTLDGLMHRGRVATKIRLDITCRPLTAKEAVIVLNAILPEYVVVEYDDPQDGHVFRSMYSNNNPATHMLIQEDGTEWWDGITFPLIEQ